MQNNNFHISFLSQEYPHSNLNRSAGLGSSIKNLGIGLIKYNVRVSVFVIGQSEDITFEDEGIQIISIAKQSHAIFNWYFERKRIQGIIQKYIYHEGISLIEAPDWGGISAFLKFSVPLIIRLHGTDRYFCYLERRKQKWKNYFFEKNALNGADGIISVSNFTANVTKELFKLNKNIQTIYNSIDTEKFKPLKKTVAKYQILYFGTIIRKKGLLELAAIFNATIEKEPRAKLVLLGKDTIDVFDGVSTIKLFYDLLTPSARTAVSHLNEVPYENVKHYIAEAHVVVLPSLAEAFPMSWLETLAMEKPLVCSNIGWASELMIDDMTGFIIDPKNHAEFSEKIITLFKDEALCLTFGEQGRKHIIQNFSSKLIIEQNLEYYKSIT